MSCRYLDLQSTMSSTGNTNNPWPQVGEEHEYYTPMLVLITSSIVLQVSFPSLLFPFIMNQRSNFFECFKGLNLYSLANLHLTELILLQIFLDGLMVNIQLWKEKLRNLQSVSLLILDLLKLIVLCLEKFWLEIVVIFISTIYPMSIYVEGTVPLNNWKIKYMNFHRNLW